MKLTPKTDSDWLDACLIVAIVGLGLVAVIILAGL